MKYKGHNISNPSYYIYTVYTDDKINLYETNFLSKSICDNVLEKTDKNNIKSIHMIDGSYVFANYNLNNDVILKSNKKIEEDNIIEEDIKVEEDYTKEDNKKVDAIINSKKIIEEISLILKKDIPHKYLKRKCCLVMKSTEENKQKVEEVINYFANKKTYGDDSIIGNLILREISGEFKNIKILIAEKYLEKRKQGKEVNYIINRHVDCDNEIGNHDGCDSGYSESDYDSDTKIKYMWYFTGPYNGREERDY